MQNQPRIAVLVGDLAMEYFIICEQKVFLQDSKFKDGIVHNDYWQKLVVSLSSVQLKVIKGGCVIDAVA